MELLWEFINWEFKFIPLCMEIRGAGKWGLLIGLCWWMHRATVIDETASSSITRKWKRSWEEEISNVEIIGNDVETKHIAWLGLREESKSQSRRRRREKDAKRSDWVKGKRNQNLSFLRTKLCCIWISMLSWSLNSIFSPFSRTSCLPSVIYIEGLSGRLNSCSSNELHYFSLPSKAVSR